MALVDELMEGRQGHTLGPTGLVGRMRVFRVEVDNDGDDPGEVMQDPALVTTGTPVAKGSPWPGDNPYGLVATEIAPFLRLGHKLYKVRITYAPPGYSIDAPTNIIDQWQWDVESNSQFIHVDFDINLNPIASPAYRTTEPVASTPEDPITPEELANLQKGQMRDDKGGWIPLWALPGKVLSPVGTDKPVRVATLKGVRKVARLPQPPLGVGSVLAHIGRLNFQEFMGAEPGALRFDALGVHPQFGALLTGGGTLQGPGDLKHWDIEITFAWNPDVWDPVRLTHVYKYDDSSMRPVFPTENEEGQPLTGDDLNNALPLISEHYNYEFTNFVAQILQPFSLA